jgi:pilus assembly protein Flp/PilA
MRKIARIVADWFSLTSERGVTAIEYGLIAALIAVVIITAVALIGTNLTTVFNAIAAKLTT